MIAALSPYLKECYREISGGRESGELVYVPSWLRKSFDLDRIPSAEAIDRTAAQERLISAMEEDAHREHERRISLYGPPQEQVGLNH